MHDPAVELRIVPTTWRAACAFVAAHHRHSAPTRGQKWALAVLADGRLCGVAQCGRPVARMLDDGLTCEVLRVCTDGTPNACSALYGACRRIARAIRFRRVVTYTLATEEGASLRAVGARRVALVRVPWPRRSRGGRSHRSAQAGARSARGRGCSGRPRLSDADSPRSKATSPCTAGRVSFFCVTWSALALTPIRVQNRKKSLTASRTE
jgi:hypothetical protein